MPDNDGWVDAQVPSEDQSAIALDQIAKKIDQLRAEIAQLAEEGRTMECDDRHSQISTLQNAGDILIGEDDA